MRLSDYTIHIPLPESDQALLVHGYSGAVDVVNQEVSAWISSPTFDPFPLSTDVLDTLRSRGYLTEKTADEEVQFINRLGEVLHRGMSNRRGFIMMPTYNCNLRCFYCFETHIRSRPYFEKVMTPEMIDAAYVFMDQLTEGEKKSSRQITIYGGEPLMSQNYEAVAYIIRQGLARGYVFKTITNGVDLETYAEFLGPGKIEFLQITLDGPPRLHDKRRIRARQYGRKETFDDIAQNITLALEKGVKVSVRTNVDALNIDGLQELQAIYDKQGWREYPNFSAYAFPAHGKNPEGKELYLSETKMVDNLIPLQAQEGSCATCNTGDGTEINNLVDIGHNFINRFKQLLANGRYPLLQPYYCSAHTGMFLLGPLGDLYACWDHVGDPTCQIGKYYPEVDIKEEALAAWRGRTTFAIPQCRQCKYALLCGGGCAYQALQQNGTLYSPNCNNFGELFTRFAPVAYQEYVAGDHSIRHASIDAAEATAYHQ